MAKHTETFSEPLGGAYLEVDFWVQTGFDLAELSSLLAIVDAFNGLTDTMLIQVKLLSKEGGRVVSAAGYAEIATKPFEVRRSPGIVVFVGGDHGDTKALVAAHSRARAFGKYVLVLSSAVAKLKTLSAFGEDAVCVPWHHTIRSDPHLADGLRWDCLYLVGQRYTSAAGHLSAPHAFLAVLGSHFEVQMTRRVAERLILGPPRSGSAAQRADTRDRYGIENPKLVQLIEIFEARFDDQISMRDSAEELGISVRQVERICRKELQRSPIQLLEDIRIRWARWHVEFTMEPLLDIAVSCGFSTATQMSKVFRRRVGKSPSELRRAAGQGAAALVERASSNLVNQSGSISGTDESSN
jgi:transcriptional regulator GlxA family with amidase domain